MKIFQTQNDRIQTDGARSRARIRNSASGWTQEIKDSTSCIARHFGRRGSCSDHRRCILFFYKG